MKKALLPKIVVFLLSVFIYSCSSDDDDSAASSVIQTKILEKVEIYKFNFLKVIIGESYVRRGWVISKYTLN
ncbi:MAG: hypothetical protein P8I34_03135 [Flavobacteriaceae bacterium]|nr:hypothetical protein [Flavobacteriaceae bacterium]